MFDMVMSTLLPQVVNTEYQMTFSSIKNIDDSAEESIKMILKFKNLVAAPILMILINKSIPISMDRYNLPLLTIPVILFIYGYRLHPTKIHLHLKATKITARLIKQDPCSIKRAAVGLVSYHNRVSLTVIGLILPL